MSERVRGSRDVRSGGMGALTASSSSVFGASGAVRALPPPPSSSTVHQCVVATADASAVATADTLLPLRAYCSPRLDRRQRSGSYPTRDGGGQHGRHAGRDFSSLRADGYLKLKTKCGRLRVDSGDSRDSYDTIGTCDVT